MNYPPDAIREVLVALLQIIPALLIAYLLLDPPRDRHNLQDRIRIIQRRIAARDERARRAARDPGQEDESAEPFGAAGADRRELADLQNRLGRPAGRFAAVVVIALAGLLFAVNGILGVGAGPLSRLGPPNGGLELVLSLSTVAILISQIAVAGVLRIASRDGLDRVRWRARIYAVVGAGFAAWLVMAMIDYTPGEPPTPAEPATSEGPAPG